MRTIEIQFKDIAKIEAELAAQSDEKLADGLARCLSHVEACKRMRDRARSNVVSLEVDAAGREAAFRFGMPKRVFQLQRVPDSFRL